MLQKILYSKWLFCYFVVMDILLFLGFSYQELYWHLVNPSNNPDWAVNKGISIIIETFVAMIIGFILPYIIYFALLNRELVNKVIHFSYIIFITVVFVMIKVVILFFLIFFNYFVRYL